MASEKDSLSQKIERVKSSIQKFPAAAETLNTATDQLGKPIVDLDSVLKKFGIGVPTWVHFTQSDARYLPDYYYEDIGYAKINGKWGIAIRVLDGNFNDGPDEQTKTEWHFADAPRFLRLRAVDKIPELLESMLEQAAEMSRKMTEKAAEITALTDAVGAVVGQSSTHKSSSAKPPVKGLPLRPVTNQSGVAK
jgi:prefoldin subunit 5